MSLLLSVIPCFVSILLFMCFSTESAIMKSEIWPPKSPQMLFEDNDNDNIRGTGGKDYPMFSSIPRTSFSCNGRIPGFYADTETDCQVFHLCFRNQRTSFLCSNGTVFNQRLFTCHWWYNTTCSDSPKYYSLNSELYKVEQKTIKNVNKELVEDIKMTKNQRVETRFKTGKLIRVPLLAQSMARNEHDLPRDKNLEIWISETTDSEN